MVSIDAFFVSTLIIIYIVLGLAVYLRKPDGKINRIFGFLILFLLLWLTSNYLENEQISYQAREIFLKLDFAFAIIIGYYFLRFCNNFPKVIEAKNKKLLLFLPVGVFAGLSITNLVIIKISILKGTIVFEPGLLFVPYALVLIGYFGTGIAVLLRKVKSVRKIERSKIIYVLLGLTLSSTIAIIVDLLLPQFIVIKKEVARIGIYGLIFFTGFTAYAIVKHRLMDIRLLVLKSVAYTLSLASVVAVYISLTLLVFQKLEVFVNHTVLDVVTLLALVFTFQPLRRFIEKRTDKLFSKGRYNFRELVGQFSDITKKHSRSVKKLTGSVLEALTKEMRIGKAE